MTSYEAFAQFYDAVMGDRAEPAAHLERLIEQRCPGAQTVLEVACGTGSILKQLRPRYEVTGLDLSEEMLAIAAEKVPDVRLIQGDMTQFNLNEAFDVVLCVYDSINHLLDFAQWEQVFDCAREHLNDRGIFVFDINTELQLASYVEEPPWTHWFGDGHLSARSRPLRGASDRARGLHSAFPASGESVVVAGLGDRALQPCLQRHRAGNDNPVCLDALR